MIPSIGATEIVIMLVVVLLLFGAKRIPELAKGLGNGVREFRKGVSDRGSDAELEGREESTEAFGAKELEANEPPADAEDARPRQRA